MLRTNESGSSALTILLLVIVTSVIGFTGWYVWHSQSETSKTIETTIKTNSSSTEIKNKTYSFGKNLELTYPSSWKVVHTDESEIEIVEITAPSGDAYARVQLKDLQRGGACDDPNEQVKLNMQGTALTADANYIFAELSGGTNGLTTKDKFTSSQQGATCGSMLDFYYVDDFFSEGPAAVTISSRNLNNLTGKITNDEMAKKMLAFAKSSDYETAKRIVLSIRPKD